MSYVRTIWLSTSAMLFYLELSCIKLDFFSGLVPVELPISGVLDCEQNGVLFHQIVVKMFYPLKKTPSDETLFVWQAALKDAKRSKGGEDKEIDSLRSEVAVSMIAHLFYVLYLKFLRSFLLLLLLNISVYVLFLAWIRMQKMRQQMSCNSFMELNLT